MITKKLKPNGKLFTKDISEYLKCMANDEGSLHVTLFSEKAISEPFFEEVKKSGRPILVRTTASFYPRVEKLGLEAVIHDEVEMDLSNKIHGIYMIEGKKYLFITSSQVIAADENEYQEGIALVGNIINYAKELR